MNLLNSLLLRLRTEEINDFVACTIRLGREEFFTSRFICSSSRIRCLLLCSVSSHSWAARFSFLRQRNKDASVICHFSDVSRAASSLMWAISSLSKFLFAFDSSFSSYFWTIPDKIWLTVSWTIAVLTDSAIRIQVSMASLAFDWIGWKLWTERLFGMWKKNKNLRYYGTTATTDVSDQLSSRNCKNLPLIDLYGGCRQDM